MLRSAYIATRYGRPESPASEWARRPQSFVESLPECHVRAYLEVLGEAASSRLRKKTTLPSEPTEP